MSLAYEFLADREDALPLIAKWYFDEWGYLKKGATLASTVERLRHSLNRDRIPFILVATADGDIIGAAELKYREMAEMFPEKEHWIGGVYVASKHRGHGFASLIAEEIACRAPAYGVEVLHLQTEMLDGGLYARLGWVPTDQVNNRGLEVLVMERYVGERNE
ncbi:MAG: GNAT family N-acetyltransferase [Gammaproteobacteria bacterium]|nr:GNAT family N-acetyltransferase [Gammaproteobacteria bacterium]